jgi:ABC-type Fe3+ transport system substrate-binding protein
MIAAHWRLMAFILGISWALLSSALAASSSPALIQAAKEAEAKGYVFLASHEAIVEAAKKEAKMRALSGFPPEAIKALASAFRKKYPFIDTQAEELESTEGYQRFALEMKAGRPTGWDATVIGLDFYKDYAPYQKRFDILGMAAQGVLNIAPQMVDPFYRNVISACSGMQVIAFNRKLILEDKVPSAWEGFLEPEFRGRKFLADIRPKDVAALVPAWGLERTLEFARKLGAQQPVWVRGGSRLLNALAAGEYPLFLGPNFNTIRRAQAKDITGNLSYKILEPVPTRLFHMADGVLNSAEHPHGALLWLEFLASPEGQKILDEHGPFQASVFTPGSAMEKETRGKKLSGVDWYHLTKMEEYQAKIVEAYGFPKAEQK